MKKIMCFFLALTMVLSMAACSNAPASSGTVPVTAPSARPQETPEPTPEATPEATPEPTPEPVLYRSFFTGEPLEEPDYTRPICIMFNNHPDALPHCGISNAAIIYEIMTESITRMMAVFPSIEDVGELGSIRSSRPPFVELSQSYGAIYVHAGGSEDAYSMIRSQSVDNIDGVRGSYPMTVFYRNPNRVGVAVEHKLFTTSDAIAECVEYLDYSMTLPEDYSSGLVFTDDATPADGIDAGKLSVTFGTYAGKYTYFNYDEDSGCYHVYQQNRDYIDGNTEEIVDFRNVIVLSTTTRIYDSMGHVSVDLTSGGEGVFACGGKAVDITWSRNDDGTFHYALTDGTPLELGVGRTYVCIISSYDGDVVIE